MTKRIKKTKREKHVKPKKQTATQKILAKIAKGHRHQYEALKLGYAIQKPIEAVVEPIKPPRKKMTSIPEDARIAVKLHEDEYGQVVFGNFRFRDLQRACIIRGMTPDDLVAGDIYKLHKFIQDHKDDEVDLNLLDDFDDWREKKLDEMGKKGEPYVKLGYIGKTDEEGNPLMVFKPKPKKPKKHIEKDASMGGLWKGTKKHLTVQCKKDGLTLDQTILKVMAAFPEAKESSIKIWYKRQK